MALIAPSLTADYFRRRKRRNAIRQHIKTNQDLALAYYPAYGDGQLPVDNGVLKAYNAPHGIPDGVEVVVNGDFADWASSTDADDWAETGDISRSSDSYTGTYAALFTVPNVATKIVQTVSGLPSGGIYRVTFWAKLLTGTPQVQCTFGASSPAAHALTSSWVQYTDYVVGNAGTNYLTLTRYNAGTYSFVIDNVSLEKLTTGRNLVQNPFFDTDTIWTKTDAAVTISAGNYATWDGSAAGVADVYQTSPITLFAGMELETIYKISGYAAGDFRLRIGGTYGAIRTADGIYKERITTTAADQLLRVRGLSNADGEVEFVIVRPVSNATNGRYAPNNLVLNNFFANWTGDDPDDWTVTEAGDATSNITENPAGHCQIISDGTDTRLLQAMLTVGKTYVVTVHVSAASGNLLFQDGGTTLTTITSAGVHKVVFTATTTYIRFRTSGVVNTTIDYVRVEQILIEPSENYPKAESLDTSGDGVMDKDNWTAGSSATLTNPSTGALRVARNAANDPYGYEAIHTIGLRYRVTGECRSDGNAVPKVYFGGLLVFTGTTSTSWQSFDIEAEATNVNFAVLSNTSTGTEYTEWRNLSVTEVNPLNIDTVAVSEVRGNRNLAKAKQGNGLTSYGQLPVELNSILPRRSGAVMLVGEFNDPASGALEGLLRWGADGATNYIDLGKTAGDDFQFLFVGGSVSNSHTISPCPSGVNLYATSWNLDDDSLRYQHNADEVGTDSGVGELVGNQDPVYSVVFAYQNNPLYSADAQLYLIGFYDSGEIAETEWAAMSQVFGGGK